MRQLQLHLLSFSFSRRTPFARLAWPRTTRGGGGGKLSPLPSFTAFTVIVNCSVNCRRRCCCCCLCLPPSYFVVLCLKFLFYLSSFPFTLLHLAELLLLLLRTPSAEHPHPHRHLDHDYSGVFVMMLDHHHHLHQMIGGWLEGWQAGKHINRFNGQLAHS